MQYHVILDCVKRTLDSILVYDLLAFLISYFKLSPTICHERVLFYWYWHRKYIDDTVYPKKYAHGFVVLCFVVVMQSFIMNSHEVFIHIHQGCFAGTGAIVRLPQCQWSKSDGYGKISQCITTTKHSKAKTVCIFLGIYCMLIYNWWRLKVNIIKHILLYGSHCNDQCRPVSRMEYNHDCRDSCELPMVSWYDNRDKHHANTTCIYFDISWITFSKYDSA